MNALKTVAVSALAAAVLAACTTAPSGRQQLLLMSDSELNQLGEQSFQQIRQQQQVSSNAAQRNYARCVVNALVAELPEPWRGMNWEIEVFADQSPNAFALPGGKMGINAGMFDLAENQHQVAAVLGHEIGHVVFRHANERISRSTLVGTGVQATGILVGARTSPETAQNVAGLLGAGAQVGVMLPFSREQEREADVYGQELMARAGFDPAQASRLWDRMIAAAGGQRAPAFISTHPNPGARARTLEQRAPVLASTYAEARQQGRNPRCG